MNVRTTQILVIVFVLLVLLAGTVATSAHGGDFPDTPEAVQGSNVSFTYQGYLKDSVGAPVNDSCDFRFTLWDADTPAGTQIGGAYEALAQAVAAGNVMIWINTSNFGSSTIVFSGAARWLEVSVRCPAGSGEYVTLTPRQQLTAVPYSTYASKSGTAPWSGLTDMPADFADGMDNNTTYTAGDGLALSGGAFSITFAGTGSATTASRSDHTHTTLWRTNGNYQTDPATNFIGTGDNVALVMRVNNLIALRIEPNNTSPNIIGGYSGNSVTAGVHGASIGGGGSAGAINRVMAHFGTVSGGLKNTASSAYDFVGGGWENTASGGYSSIGGGNGNQATQYATSIAGGLTNQAVGLYATVGGGETNTAGGESSTVCGGADNSASGESSSVGGGSSNSANGTNATIPGGSGAAAPLYGQMSYASGYFETPGDAQASLYVVRNTTYNANWTNLYLDGTDDWISIPVGRTVAFDILVVGRSATDSAAYQITGVIDNVGGLVEFIGTPVITVLGEDRAAWDAIVAASPALGVFGVQVRGSYIGENIHWVASIRTVEVAAP